MKNQWGWGGFTTHDLARCRLAARLLALFYDWWNILALIAIRVDTLGGAISLGLASPGRQKPPSAGLSAEQFGWRRTFEALPAGW